MAETTSPAPTPSPLPEDLLEVLACPVCHAPVRLSGDRLVCEGCGRKYAILEGGIPDMLKEHAEQ